MLLVSLTGGIGCGKSIIARVFKEKGCYIHSADITARELMAPDRPAWKKIVTRFGNEVCHPDRTINRKRLGAIIFSDPKAREFLNNLIHPLVHKERLRLISELEKQRRWTIFISEAALTVEAGLTDQFDKIVVVFCSEREQIRRLMERDDISEEEARLKIQAQMPQSEKCEYADYKIDASGTLSETVEQAEKIYALLIQDYALKNLEKAG